MALGRSYLYTRILEVTIIGSGILLVRGLGLLSFRVAIISMREHAQRTRVRMGASGCIPHPNNESLPLSFKRGQGNKTCLLLLTCTVLKTSSKIHFILYTFTTKYIQLPDPQLELFLRTLSVP